MQDTNPSKPRMNGLKGMYVRMSLPSMHAMPQVDRPGIAVVGVLAENEFPALLLIWDEGPRNTGVSATNAIERVLHWLDQNWLNFPVRDAIIIERDSMGAFDHALPTWPLGVEPVARLPAVAWRPVRWEGTEPRSEAAFKALFAPAASLALKALHEVLAAEIDTGEVRDE